jgi:3-oxoacyl-[acyl-carrier-protein] synthase III
MLEAKVAGVRMAAITTSLPTAQQKNANNQANYVCHELQTTADLGFDAAERIIASLSVAKEDIGILLFGSKTPDYRSPNTAAILQGRLGLAIDCICFDTNVGANGFIKMTQVATALLVKSNSKYALVVTGDTPSKLQQDKAGKPFDLSDAATAILLEHSITTDTLEFSSYADGTNYKGYYLKEGGFRDFNTVIPFDGSKSENYIVKSEIQELDAFFKNSSSFLKNTSKEFKGSVLVNSLILNNLKITDNWKNQRAINTDASELPLLLEALSNENLLKDSNIQFISAGEGMALMTMTINNIPQIIATQHTSVIFEEYKISHEM